MQKSFIRLKKQEDKRIRAGHLWIYSNEIDNTITPLKQFTPGQIIQVEAYDKQPLGIGYINPHSLIAVRLLNRNVNEIIDEAWFIKRIKKAYQWRQQLYPKPFYRVIFGESDGLPGLVVDRFGEHLAVQLNTTGMEFQKENILNALIKAIPNISSILWKNDSNARLQEGLGTYVASGYGNPPEYVLLEENEVKFQAPLWEGQKTGWFYDHRLNRSRLKGYVKEKRVLDVFSYLGGWGIQAAVFGAKEVYCIDGSSLAAKWIEENARLNAVDDRTKVVCNDAFAALKDLNLANEKFDVIILDPPAFVKKQKDHKAGLLAYQRINEAALRLLNQGGLLFSCSCSMHISQSELIQSVRKASLKNGRQLQIVEQGHQAPDHPIHLSIPETDYLKMIAFKDLS